MDLVAQGGHLFVTDEEKTDEVIQRIKIDTLY